MKKAKTTVAHPAKPAKPPAKGHLKATVVQTRKTSAKHKATAKHKSQKHAAKRGWSPDEAYPWCSARAVCEALGLADPWAIHTLAGGTENRPVSILAALEATQRLGVARSGVSPGSPLPDRSDLKGAEATPVTILGVDWPEPHAVVELDGLWWSWGELYEPWTDQISEAWVIT